MQSNNWRLDYKMLAGVSYADIVKSNWCVLKGVNNPEKGLVGSQVNKSCYRTYVPKTSVKPLNHTKSLIKRSDVHSNIRITHSVRNVKNNTSNRVNYVPLDLHNRFHVFNNMHGIESHEVNSIHDID